MISNKNMIDPKRVTIFGQSAGAQSVTALLSSSAAKGLFSAAIPQSSPVDLPWFSEDVYYNTVTPNVARAAGCIDTNNEQNMVDCLRQQSFELLLSNSTLQSVAEKVSSLHIGPDFFKESPIMALVEYFMPSVGNIGNVIDGQFYDLLANNKLPNKVPVMFSTVKDEGFLFIDEMLPPLGNTPFFKFIAEALALSPSDAEAMQNDSAFAVNTSDPDAVRNAVSTLLTTREWLCAQEFLLNISSPAAGSPVFPSTYQIFLQNGHIQSTYNTISSPSIPQICMDPTRACHTSDILPVWGTLNYVTQYTPSYSSNEEVLYSQFLNDVWSAFIRTHTPNLDADYLRARGASYNHSLSIIDGDDGYRFREYGSPSDTNYLGFDIGSFGHKVSPYENQCPLLTQLRYTFQRIEE